jgi:hypothetical protein
MVAKFLLGVLSTCLCLGLTTASEASVPASTSAASNGSQDDLSTEMESEIPVFIDRDSDPGCVLATGEGDDNDGGGDEGEEEE